MTDSEKRSIVDSLHAMELRVLERLARVETEIRESRKDSDRLRVADERLTEAVGSLRADFSAEQQLCQARTNRVVLGVVLVGLVAGGDLAAKMLTIL